MEPRRERRVYAGFEVADCKYADCTSTNEVAAMLVHDASFFASLGFDRPVPVVVSAGHQSSGRGRRGKTWVGADGENLYLSIALPAPVWTSHYADYQVLGCMAVFDALVHHLSERNLRLKYPNDVMVISPDKSSVSSAHLYHGRKISGVLVETEFRGSEISHVVCGMGVNVNQEDFTDQGLPEATSLHAQLGRRISPEDVRERVVEEFFCLLRGTCDELYAAWVERLDLEGCRIRTDAGEGPPTTHTVVRVERDGTLRVRDVVDGVESHDEHLLNHLNTSFRVELDHAARSRG